MTVTWSPTLKSAHVTLSNGSLTATTDGSGGLNFTGGIVVPAGAIAAAAKFVWDTTITTTGGNLGIVNGSWPFTDSIFLGNDLNGIGNYGVSGVFLNNTLVTTLAGMNPGDIVQTACIGGSLIWWRVNGGGWNNDILANQNPATATGGISIAALGTPVYPAYNVQGAAGAVTANFGPSLSQTPPAGFSLFNPPVSSFVETRYFALHKSRR